MNSFKSKLMVFYLISLNPLNPYHLIAFFQQDDTCLESKKTLEIVSICPTNENAFKERSEKKNCNILSTCAGESLFYHCVMFDGMLIDVCALRTPITGF